MTLVDIAILFGFWLLLVIHGLLGIFGFYRRQSRRINYLALKGGVVGLATWVIGTLILVLVRTVFRS